jgi:isopentenyl-diphosphate delta-isomerase type 1
MTKNKNQHQEIFSIVDLKDKVVGRATRKQCHQNKKLIHRAFQAYLFNKKGQVLLQKRSLLKDTYPGYWTASCSGHLDLKENYKQALVREAKEELGLDLKSKDFKFIDKFLIKMPSQTEFNGFFLSCYKQSQGMIKPFKKEIDKVSWFKLTDLFKKIKKDKIKTTFTCRFFLTDKRIQKEMLKFAKGVK